MAGKFVPNGDLDFLTKAESFARTIAKDPARFDLAPGDADELAAAAARFRAAYQASRFGGRSEAATRAKNDARAEAVRVYRRLGHLVRSNPRLDAATKILVGIHEREPRPKVQPCPSEPPRLRFVRALHEGGGATPVHELEFRAFDHSPAKPGGAVRVELFVDLIPPDEPIPARPGANLNSRPWYLRSYTRSPIKLTPPMARVPMRVVYWARWADSLGNVGPFSATAVAWIEGGTHALLPGGTGLALGGRKPVPILEDATGTGPANREPHYSVAVLEAQFRSFHPQHVPPAMVPGAAALPAPHPPEQAETRRLEGPPPPASEAA